MIYIYKYRSTLPRECDIICVIKQYFLCVTTQGSDNAGLAWSGSKFFFPRAFIRRLDNIHSVH